LTEKGVGELEKIKGEPRSGGKSSTKSPQINMPATRTQRSHEFSVEPERLSRNDKMKRTIGHLQVSKILVD
jgi:hypothetical protein